MLAMIGGFQSEKDHLVLAENSSGEGDRERRGVCSSPIGVQVDDPGNAGGYGVIVLLLQKVLVTHPLIAVFNPMFRSGNPL
jgi:hypothetical protein